MIDDERQHDLDELGSALTNLRASLDSTLARWRATLDAARDEPVAPDSPITPNAVPAVLDFLRALPGIVGQSVSGDDARLQTARESLAELQQELAASGIDTDDRLTGFADRLARLRRDTESRRSDATTESTRRAQDPGGRPTGEPDTTPSNEGSSL